MGVMTTVGNDPYCGDAIPQIRVLIEYNTTDGSAIYAECPDCLDVVHPG